MKNTKYSLEKLGPENLYRIRALRDIPRFNVKAGAEGGRVSSLTVLDTTDDSWIDYGSTVRNSKITGNSLISSSQLTGAVVEESIISYSASRADLRCVKSVLRDVTISEEHSVGISSSMLLRSTFVSGAYHSSISLSFVNSVEFHMSTGLHDSCVSGIGLTHGFPGVRAITLRSAYIQAPKDLLICHNVGSEDGTLVAYRNMSNSVQVRRGCFNGTLTEFAAAVKATHKRTRYAKEYDLLVKFIAQRIKPRAYPAKRSVDKMLEEHFKSPFMDSLLFEL